MSFSRNNYESCAYRHKLAESVGPGEYTLTTPTVCNPCFVPSSSVNVGRYGAATCTKELIDVDSELLGITRKSSRCPEKKYLPSDKPFCTTTVPTECNDLDAENTRLSNPPCTLRCRGWNRWEWLCQNPQDQIEIPFNWNISNRTIVKNNHRPCIPTPLDQTLALPQAQSAPSKPLFCGTLREPHHQSYGSCKAYKQI
jgi:hypothetical protein